MRFTALVASFLISLAAAATAHAQPRGAPAQPVPPPPPPPVADSQPDVDQGVIDDANSGRSWMSPTALTPPAGTWSFNDYQLFLVGGSYAFTDKFVMSASTLVPLTNDFPFTLMLTGKLQLVRQGRIRLAAHGTYFHFNEGGSNTSDFSFNAGAVGGALTYCLDADCHSYANVYAGAGFSAESDNSSVPVMLAGSLAYRLGRRVKAVFEADSGLILGDINEVGEGIVAWFGVRFTSKHMGVDFGFVRPVCSECDGDDMPPIGFPWLSFTYRGGL